MTREGINTKLKALITCMKCEVSGKPCDDNCPTQYEAGHTGEIIENLEAISKALEALNKIRAEIEDLDIFYDNDYFSSNTDAMFKRNEVLAIIDKYKAESEG